MGKLHFQLVQLGIQLLQPHLGRLPLAQVQAARGGSDLLLPLPRAARPPAPAPAARRSVYRYGRRRLLFKVH
jgi:hypothetical protein